VEQEERLAQPCDKMGKGYGEKGINMWDFSTIKQIIANPVYIGTIASQKANYRFKVGWLGDKKLEE